ncbi:hypothetical protein [Simplicispira suum]|uniref:hypothetical protein n=1 Tax=Simplicispira suum TaxID=2109915 RepID=UPI0011B27E7F|nr:hypothetical protein [Simplicispira suum]
MTTFDFSLHAAPGEPDWQRRFTNDKCPPTLLEFEAYGISGWAAHSAYVTWADKEKIKRNTPDWCLHVAACSRMQLLVLINAFAKALPQVDEATLFKAVSQLNGEHFVVRIAEF